MFGKKKPAWNGNPENIPTGTLGLGAGVTNIGFNSSANIVPSMVVNPRAYQDGNIVLGPLSYTGQPGPPELMDHVPFAGALTTAPGPLGFDALQAYPHYYSINGVQPGR